MFELEETKPVEMHGKYGPRKREAAAFARRQEAAAAASNRHPLAACESEPITSYTTMLTSGQPFASMPSIEDLACLYSQIKMQSQQERALIAIDLSWE